MPRIRTMIATVALFSISSAQAFATGTISGTVFNDYNSNGTFDTAATLANDGGGTTGLAVDTGVSGVTVTAFDSNGAAVGTATSAANGTYTLSATGTGPYRIEFTSIPTGFQSSFHGADSGTTVQFVPDGTSTNVNLGIARPSDYCQNNPTLVTNCYNIGNQLSSSNAPFLDVSGRAAIHAFPYSSGALTTPGALAPAPTSLATASQVGATWGLAYSRTARTLFAGAFFKRHAGFGPGADGVGQSGASTSGDDAGAIYVLNPSGGLVTTLTVPGATTNAHDTTDYNRDNGTVGWDAVGKTSLGGLAMSDDGTTLYAMNLENRTLYAMNPTDGAVLATQQVPMSLPGCPAAVDVRPFAVQYHHGSVFVGMVCSAESSQSVSDLNGYVYQVDPVTLAFGATPAFQFALNYPRGGVWTPGPPAEWLPWSPTLRTNNATVGTYPQPILTDIEFDGDNLVIALRDRSSDQFGNNTLDNPANSTLYGGIAAGDTVRACGSLAAGWSLESNGRCDGLGTAPQNTGQGPGNGEYYFGDGYSTFHEEIALGAVAQVPGFPDVLSTVFDPRTQYDYLIFDTGVRWWNNATGAISKTYMNIDGGASDGLTFAKGNGIGDLIALCDAAPIEIGNRVWIDANADGVQDPDEAPVVGVTVELVDGTDTVVGTATTDADGLYYFNTSNVTGGVLPNTDYTIRIAGGQAPLDGFAVTTANADSTTNGDSRDSDGIAGSGGLSSVAITTGPAGSNNHTYDFGYTPTVSLGNQVFSDVNDNGIRDGSELGISGVDVALYMDADGDGVPDSATAVATATTNTDGYYLFTDLTPGTYVVEATAPTGYRSSTDVITTPVPDGDIDLDDNGIGTSTATVRSGSVTLLPSAEPTSEDATVGITDTTADDSSNLTVDFGFVETVSLGNQVFSDLNDNGLRDASEAGVGGVHVALYADADGDGVPDSATAVATATTNSSGYYLFTGLVPGGYVVEATIPSGFRSSTDITSSASPDNDTDLDDNGIGATSGTVRSGTITLAPSTEPTGEAATVGISDATADANSNLTVDFGIIDAATVSLGNLVFDDINDNGKRDSSETGVSGVTVDLYVDADGDGTPDGAAIKTTTTNSTGYYLFTDLIAGKYVVAITTPTGFRSSTDIATTANPNGNVDSDDNGRTASTGTVYSGSITLSVGGEPKGEGATPGRADATPDANSNVTVDFGITQGRTRLTITKKANVTAQKVGGLVVYTIAVTNRGSAPARNVQICDTVPVGMSFVSASAGSRKLSGRRCWTISSLSGGATAHVRITLRVTFNASPTITNIALVTAGNATRVYSTARVSGVGVRGAVSPGVTG